MSNYYTAAQVRSLYLINKKRLEELVDKGLIKVRDESNDSKSAEKRMYYGVDLSHLTSEMLYTAEEEKEILKKIKEDRHCNEAFCFIRANYSIGEEIITVSDTSYEDKSPLVGIIIDSIFETFDSLFAKKNGIDGMNKRFYYYLRDVCSKKVAAMMSSGDGDAKDEESDEDTVGCNDKTTPDKNADAVEESELDIAISKLKSIIVLNPRELYDKLGEIGYCGQDSAREKMCLMAYRHIRRLKDHYIDGVPFEKLTAKSNVMLLGPTGCGKTYMTKLLFEKMLGLPVAVCDMTTYTESGYVGMDTGNILFTLQRAARGNNALAEMGIAVLDEFDKIAATEGEGDRDVSGRGVQRELLKIIEGGRQQLAGRTSRGRTHYAPEISTDLVSFVACGAFSGMELTCEVKSTMGFVRQSSGAKPEPLSDKEIAKAVCDYGFMPELVGRFTSIVALSGLEEEALKDILVNNVLPAYQREYEREGLELEVPEEVICEIVANAKDRGTGARGLSIELTEYLEKDAFMRFGAVANGNETKINREK